MHTFLTPEPITIEIRNAAGEIRVDLADVATTTVDVVASTSHPLGFLDDVIRAAKNQFAGDRGVNDGGRARFGPSFGGTTDTIVDDPAERARVDLRQPTDTEDAEAADGRPPATLIVDTDPARDGWKSSFIVHVTAPVGSGVRIQSQSADVTMSGPAKRLEVRTASGDVRIGEVAGRSVVQTASGDVSIAATAECDVRTASGDIEVRKVSAEAVLHSTSGDV
jgi:Putative adhesin